MESNLKYTCQVWDSRTWAYSIVSVLIPHIAGRRPAKREDSTADEIAAAVAEALLWINSPWYVVNKSVTNSFWARPGVMARHVIIIELREVGGGAAVIVAVEERI